MDIHQPKKGEITVFSKSGCPNCTNVKKLLKEKSIKFVVVECDEFILEDKEAFLQFIKTMALKECNTFPMIFDGTIFVGGYKETISYLEKMLDFDLVF
jgi:glutaredoxin